MLADAEEVLRQQQQHAQEGPQLHTQTILKISLWDREDEGNGRQGIAGLGWGGV